MTTHDQELQERLAVIGRVFTPSTPVTGADVFSGRQVERERLIRAVFEPGRHAVIYGARGVGKTSLANIVARSLAADGGAVGDALRTTIRVSCTREDTFDSVWRHLAREASIIAVPGAETVVESTLTQSDKSLSIASAIFEHPEIITATDIERVFRHATRAVLIFDEFDTLEDRESRAAFADMMKMMSDSGTGPTIVLVGVGDDIGTLIEDHESIQRSVQQIDMPVMTDDEIGALVETGMELLRLDVGGDATKAVVWLSRGFPSFAHSLAKEAATIAVTAGRSAVESDDVFEGAVEALAAIPYSLGETYQRAADNRHPSDTTAVALAAAAYCGPDPFRPSDVREVLASWGIDVQLQTVTNRLRGLCAPDRGSVLRAIGDTHPTYQFRDPMMPPYVVIENAERYPPGGAALR